MDPTRNKRKKSDSLSLIASAYGEDDDEPSQDDNLHEPEQALTIPKTEITEVTVNTERTVSVADCLNAVRASILDDTKKLEEFGNIITDIKQRGSWDDSNLRKICHLVQEDTSLVQRLMQSVKTMIPTVEIPTQDILAKKIVSLMGKNLQDRLKDVDAAVKDNPEKIAEVQKLKADRLKGTLDDPTFFERLSAVFKHQADLSKALEDLSIEFYRLLKLLEPVPYSYGDYMAYIASVYQNFGDESAKRVAFDDILREIREEKIDRDQALTKVVRLMDPTLLPGFNFFLPENAKPTEQITANAIDSFFDNEKLMACLKATNVAVKDDPTKSAELLKIKHERHLNRFNNETLFTKLTILVQHQPALSQAFKELTAEYCGLSKLLELEPVAYSYSDYMAYKTSVYLEFVDNSTKRLEFDTLLEEIGEQKLNREQAIKKVVKLMKNHPALLPGFNFFLPK